MSNEAAITYPPELLPTPMEGDEVEVVVVDPDTRRETIVAVTQTERLGRK